MNSSRLATFVIRLRWVIIALFSALTVYFALQLPKAEMDTEMKNQLPEDLPTRVNLNKIEELFGGTDMAMVVVSADDILEKSTLTQVRDISEGMGAISECERTVSLFTAKDLSGELGELVVEPAVPGIPETAEEKKLLRKRLSDNQLVYGNLISKDFQYAVAICFLSPEASDASLISKLRTLAQETPGQGEALVGGMPLTRVALTQDMRKDMKRFLPIGLLIMLVFLLTCFRQARGVILPFLMTVMAIIVTMGLIPLLGWKIHTVTILLPVILLAVANDYGIHIMARYQEDNAPGNQLGSRELAHRGVVELARPILATGITTIVGMLCLLSHMIIPAKQLGMLAGFGVFFAVAGSVLFIPALLSVLPKAKPVFDVNDPSKKSGVLDRLLLRVARAIPKHPKGILITSVVVCLGVGAGATRIVVDTNPMSFYHQSEPIWRSTHLLNEHLGGWAGVSVIAEGDIKDPKVLRQIDDLEQHLQKHPLVGSTTSIAGMLREMNVIMHDGDEKYDRIPETRQLVAQYLLLYTMSGSEEDFSKLVDFDYEHAQLMAKVTDSGTRAATEVLEYTRSFMKEQEGDALKMVGGLLDVMADMVHHIVWGQIMSLAWAAGLVTLVVALLLRSLVAGFLAVSPLLLALAMIFGVMGFAGIELNLVTALLSSIMIGVGVDYSIHFLWRYRDERRAGQNPVEAVERSLATTGRGIVFNGFSVVVGFVVLIISQFYPVRFFGLLVAISILASLIAALVVIPAIVIIFRPKFLEPKTEGNPS